MKMHKGWIVTDEKGIDFNALTEEQYNWFVNNLQLGKSYFALLPKRRCFIFK